MTLISLRTKKNSTSVDNEDLRVLMNLTHKHPVLAVKYLTTQTPEYARQLLDKLNNEEVSALYLQMVD